MRTRVELENAINGSPLFSIDRNIDKELFIAEEKRFLNDLARLMSMTSNDFIDTGLEILQTAKACINGYKMNSGKPFLNYFRSSLKENLSRQKARTNDENARGGLKIGREMRRRIWNIRQLTNLAEVRGEDIDAEEFPSKIANTLNISLEAVKEAIIADDHTKILWVDAEKHDDKGKLLDTISDNSVVVEEEFSTINDKFRALILSVEETFRNQKRANTDQGYLAKLLTKELLDIMKEKDIEIVKEIFAGVTFLDREVCDYYQKNGRTPKIQEIAKAAGKSPESASRTLKELRNKIQKSVKFS
jgi:DNA-directed RNA polymerase specialized sigma subunit